MPGSSVVLEIDVDQPAAWCWAPLRDLPFVSDPDLKDDPPRYTSPPDGGWRAVGDAVSEVLKKVESELLAVSDPVATIQLSTNLTRDQIEIVQFWFSRGEAPQLDAGDDAWLNGRHRMWGLRDAGFEVAPILLISLSDAIYYLEDDPLGWPPLDAESLGFQADGLDWWRSDPEARPWRTINPDLARRWEDVLSIWALRLAVT